MRTDLTAFSRVKYRVAGAYGILVVLIIALITLQIVGGDRLLREHAERDARIGQIREANHMVLQRMTDAESGVRGFQLTGDAAFLEPYESGRTGAYDTFQSLDTAVTDTDLRHLLALERDAAMDWLYAYAIPIVNAGVADADAPRLAAGKRMFDHIRTTNADLDDALDTRQQAVTAADERDVRLSQLLFAGIAVLILLTGLGLALLHQRHLLAPLEHIRLTMRRLTDGDLSARAVPAGPAELRAVVADVNDLADKTEQLLAAEQARAAGNELIQAVAAELKADRELDAISERIAALIGAGLGAEAVHARVFVDPDADIVVCWPAGAAPRTTAADVMSVPLVRGADGEPGALQVVRPDRPEWTEAERALLVAVAGEIGHAVRQERLRRSQDRLIGELRTLDEQKDVFVSTVTHELRTPLTSILGYTELLVDDDDLVRAQRRALDAIVRNAHRLEATVADLLLLDRTNQRAQTEAVPVNLAELAAGLHRDLDAAARAKDLSSELATGPAWVRGDGTRLKRAMRNLMENAIKFTPAGGHLECRLTADDEFVVVSVTDTGIGIPAADVPGLFTPFHRAANAMDQAVQGNGLGLAIVRDIVTEHGGTVAARSELGRGSTFTMTLPALAAK
jgi:two-component system phosphate regulon sensor histidine kinase PhoR